MMTYLLQPFEEGNTEGVLVALSVNISDVDDDRVFMFMGAKVKCYAHNVLGVIESTDHVGDYSKCTRPWK